MGWILTVTRNLAPDESPGAGAGSPDWRRSSGWPSPRTPQRIPEDRALLEQALGTLEEQSRRIVLLHAVTGLKHREIAQLLELHWPLSCPNTTAH